ncbi:hypothetical protein T484DRAFT_2748776 [Baffinella frigidus]|nr:hypothetical protein T484DRAFT_2748776 [Cryptophyta sp. CCMP2293]
MYIYITRNPTLTSKPKLQGLAEIMGNKDMLVGMVKYHMLEGVQDGPSFRLQNGKKLMTLQGSELTVEYDENQNKAAAFVDQAKVETYDLPTDEGIFHIIDWVNMPIKK